MFRELCCSTLKQQRENQYLTMTYYTECSTVWLHYRLLISNMLMLVPCYKTSFEFKRISINSARHTIIHSFLILSQAGICAIRDRLSTTSQCRRFRMPALRPDRPSDWSSTSTWCPSPMWMFFSFKHWKQAIDSLINQHTRLKLTTDIANSTVAKCIIINWSLL